MLREQFTNTMKAFCKDILHKPDKMLIQTN